MKLKYLINKKEDLRFARTKKEKRALVERYLADFPYLKYSCREYQKSWNKINNQFSRYIEKATGYKWKYNTYYCFVSPIHEGISNWGTSNKIIRWWKENSYTQRRITAHELIISHYFTIVKKYYSKKKLTNKQIWALAEIAAFALTSLTPATKKFWPWDKSGYYYNHNYQTIMNLQKELKQSFLKKKNFDEYIKTGIKLVRKYPKIDFC
ncbi:MAG: hypothetical protein WC868_06330 [Bacteroidales bacterium]